MTVTASHPDPSPLPFTPIPIPAGGLTGPRPTGY